MSSANDAKDQPPPPPANESAKMALYIAHYCSKYTHTQLRTIYILCFGALFLLERSNCFHLSRQ